MYQVGQVYPVGDLKAEGTFTLIKCSCKKIILKQTINGYNNFYKSTPYKGHLIFSDKQGKPQFITKLQNQAEIISVGTENIENNYFSISKDKPKCKKHNHYILDKVDENNNKDTLQGIAENNKIVFYSDGKPKYIMTDEKSLIMSHELDVPSVRTQKLILNNDPNKNKTRHVSYDSKSQMCSPNEFMCGVTGDYTGYSLGGIAIKCCKFDGN